MKLASIELDGYRRFATRQCLRLDGRIVALLGANEAGKTSILRAVQTIGSDEGYRATGPSQDITRRKSLPANHVVLTAKFQLDASDLEALNGIEEAGSARWLIVEKVVTGGRKFTIAPAVKRSVERRNELITILEEILRASSEKRGASELSVQIGDRAEAALASIQDHDAETLSSGTFEKLRALHSVVNVEEAEGDWSTDLLRLIAYEEQEHPQIRATALLSQRLPQFAMFEDQDRILDSTYDLRTFFAQKPRAPIPRALQNLTDACGLSLKKLFDASQSGDRGSVRTMITAANKAIEDSISKAWTQSDLEVLLDLDNGNLSILIRSTGGDYESLSERSEGLRQFVALSAFLSRRVQKQNDIVLLIDEAEAHLHYDAQADLVQMLGKQNLARQVLYTTHSMGCFPGDFGAGVRVVRAEGASSEILNKLWTEDGVGLTPILTGMGAETMAFFPFRSCVLTEGAGDILLLPALLRATGQETLEFHVLPGLAEISGRKIPIIQNSGRHVVFLLDGDEGGDAIQRKLVQEGVSEEAIFRLKDAAGAKCVIEDFINKDVYVAAVNAELARSNRQLTIRANDLPDVMRPAALTAWCKQHGIPAPGKVSIAYEVIEQMNDKDIVDHGHIEGLLSTRDDMVEALHAKADSKKGIAA